jgi:hypothetical protein
MATAGVAAPAIQRMDPTFCQGQSDLQTGLMVVTVATSILSLIPAYRIIGATVMRSAALISLLDLCQETWQRSDWRRKVATCAKVAATALGLVAIATSSSGFLIAGLVGDVAVQIFEITRTPKGPKKIIHCGFLAVNVLVITGIALASWKIMLVASIVSAVAMLILGARIDKNATTWKDRVISACYFALGGVGIASGVTVSHMTKWIYYGHNEPIYAKNWFTGKQYVAGYEFVEDYRLEHDIGLRLPVKDYNTLPLAGQVAAEIVER